MKVKIACYDFAIKKTSPKEAAASGEFGSFSQIESLIRIEDGLKPDRELQTTIHETLHGIFKYYYGRGHEIEEEIVAAMSVGIAQVVRDNPIFIRHLEELVGKIRREEE